MGPLVFLLAQAGSATAGELPPPDIELVARADIRSAEIRSAGKVTLSMRAEPGEAPPVRVTRSAPAGASRYRDLRIKITAIARLAEPEKIGAINLQTGDNQ